MTDTRRIRRPLDTPERREAIRSSEEVRELKRLARIHRVSCRRVRRVGEVRFQIGIRGGDRASLGAHGTVFLTDEGRISHAHLFGIDYPDAGELVRSIDSILEFGAVADVPAEIVLEALPDVTAPVTGLIPVVTGSLPVVIAITDPEVLGYAPPRDEGTAVAEVVDRAPDLPELAGPVTGPVRLVRVEPVPTGPIILPAARKTLAQRQAEVLASVPPAWKLWLRFTVGLLLALVPAMSLVGVTVTGGTVPAVLDFLGMIVFIVGVLLVASAIRTNDYRVDKLRAVGIR